jgi:hypothetical protein
MNNKIGNKIFRSIKNKEKLYICYGYYPDITKPNDKNAGVAILSPLFEEKTMFSLDIEIFRQKMLPIGKISDLTTTILEL